MLLDIMQVCMNGHPITDMYNNHPENRKDFCDKCGAKTINSCLKCNTPIKGYDLDSGVVAPITISKHCDKCGEPYPWTKKDKEIKEQIENKTTNPILLVEHICKRFHLIVREIRERYDNRNTLDISDEYDVQDLLRALLKIHFDDIRPEEWTPSYAGGCSRMDFLLKNEKIVVEVKKTRKGLDAKGIGEQLLIDIAKYQQHADCKILFCFIYDPEGRISNPQAIERDLNKQTKKITVKVLIVPKGY